MKKVSLKKITTRGKAIYLAYDQGFEHGPGDDFNDKNIDPLYIIDIAKKGKYNGVIFHKGISEKYHKEIMESKVPLILKLNGRTKLVKGDPLSAQVSTVKDAIKLKASAVGFTIYIGSKYEEQMIEEFSRIEREAHSKGLPVILWVYPRGGEVKSDVSRESIAYAARIALELGADMAKIKYGGNKKDLEWAIKSAGRTKVVIAGGSKTSEKLLLKQASEIMKSGASGLAIGRNVWQSENPLDLTNKLKKIIFK
jgi:class I fructose-bisphosphate aldolase